MKSFTIESGVKERQFWMVSRAKYDPVIWKLVHHSSSCE